MRSLILATVALVAAGCDPDVAGTAVTATRAGSAGDSPVHQALEQSAASDETLRKLGVDRADDPFAPSARGGGPPEQLTEYAWPHQARTRLADARCRALSQCAPVDVDACVTRETQRLAGWPGAGCRPLSVDACIEAARTGGCEGMDWPLPQSCAATFVCKEAHDVGH